MPCYSNYEQKEEPSRIVYRESGIRTEQFTTIINHNKKLEAALCAIINELETRGIAAEILTDASFNGQINLFGFWETHSNEDEARLSSELAKFSKHEQKILKKLLKK